MSREQQGKVLDKLTQLFKYATREKLKGSRTDELSSSLRRCVKWKLQPDAAEDAPAPKTAESDIR